MLQQVAHMYTTLGLTLNLKHAQIYIPLVLIFVVITHIQKVVVIEQQINCKFLKKNNNKQTNKNKNSTIKHEYKSIVYTCLYKINVVQSISYTAYGISVLWQYKFLKTVSKLQNFNDVRGKPN